MIKPKAYILRTAGTNCDEGTQFAFHLAGADAEIIDIKDLIKGQNPISGRKFKLSDCQILAIPGGFSNGDYIRSGKIFADDLKHYLENELRDFIESGKLIIGICNGFQVLTNYGLLPGLDGKIEQTVSLTYNQQQRFRCDWVRLSKPMSAKQCIWTDGIDRLDLPIANGEGKFVADDELLKEMFGKGLVQFQYSDMDYNPVSLFPYNPNNSMESIAAICNESRNVFGLMPHPERFIYPKRHRFASLQEILGRNYVNRDDKFVKEMIRTIGKLPDEGQGLKIFKNGVNYFK
ncbi:phosphoribosylformylglycinamidine synthase I [Candidatus Pacearchaeota archaeon]|nr:phosphoribosylformylglycinamidine synthase I [Candidatus Pacearchaeota archaeon]